MGAKFDIAGLEAELDHFPRVVMGHAPTPLERMDNLSTDLGLDLWVKRDDCTGIGMGGNKVRQLEYYFGAARAEGADTVLITGAVQSNFVRTTAAFAAKLGMECHIQLEERVPGVSELYRQNGNVLLDRLLGAHLHSYPEGEDEAGADAAMRALADDLRGQGKTPYVIPLGAESKPTGSLGYARGAAELMRQMEGMDPFDEIFIASGSALTHIGVLYGLRAAGCKIPVTGICVRRNIGLQGPRVAKRIADLCAMTGRANPVPAEDIRVEDGALAPGYGQMGATARDALSRAARREGLFLDPVYTAKVLAGLILRAEANALEGKRVIFWHTGGTPALFAYADRLALAAE